MQVTKTSNGMVEEFRVVLSQGGVRALYRGLLPNFAKSAPAVSIRSGRVLCPGSTLQHQAHFLPSYAIYEHMKVLLKIT